MLLLVGGLPASQDLPPSVIFTLLYALPFARIALRGSFPWILAFGTIPIALERIAIFSLRASQSHVTPAEKSMPLLLYQQLTFSVGFIIVASDCIFLLRCLLVNTTLKDKERASEDLPRQRFLYRRACELAGLLCLGTTIPCFVAAVTSAQGLTGAAALNQAFVLQSISSGLALFLILILLCATRIARHHVKHMDTAAADFLSTVIALLAVVPIYRLASLSRDATSLTQILPNCTFARGESDSPVGKPLFYGFHVLPEWGAVILLTTFNITKIFNIGPWGDRYFSDRMGIPVLRKNGELPLDDQGREVPELRQPEAQSICMV